MTTTVPEVIGVREAGGTWSDDVRAIKVVWQRELIRFGRSRIRIVTSLAQPLIFLFVLGGGLSSIVPAAAGGHTDFRTFMFPGVLAMTILFTSIFSAVSIVWDRELGFLREMLVAPVRRANPTTIRSCISSIPESFSNSSTSFGVTSQNTMFEISLNAP